MNLPVGSVAFAGIVATMRRDHADASRAFDALGFTLLALALALLQLMLDRGQSRSWFESTEVAAEAFFCGIFAWMFVVHTATRRHSFVDASLLHDRNFVAALLLMFAVGLSVLSPAVLLPGFLQHLQGYSPSEAGDISAMRGVSSVMAMVIAGRLIGRVDARLIMSAGVLANVGSLWLMSGLTLDSSWSQVSFAAFTQGFGAPFTFVPLSVAAYATLPSSSRAEAGVILTLVRNVGASVGISATVAILARSAATNSTYMAEHFTAYDVPRLLALGGTPGANTGTAHVVLEIGRQAEAIAYSNDFALLAALGSLGLPLVWLMKMEGRKATPAASVVDASGQ